MNNLSLTDLQLATFRGMQGVLLKLGQDDVPADILMRQVENIERMVNDCMNVFVVSALVKAGIGIPVGAEFHLLSSQIVCFRELQAEGFLIARYANFELWKRHQYKIEQWVSDQLDNVVLAVTQGLIKVRGN